MLQPIVGVAVGSAGSLKLCAISRNKMSKWHWLFILAIKESRNRTMGHVARTGRAEMRAGFWWGSVKDRDKGHLEDIAWSKG